MQLGKLECIWFWEAQQASSVVSQASAQLGLSFGWVSGKAQAALSLIVHVLCNHRDCKTPLAYSLALLAQRH